MHPAPSLGDMIARLLGAGWCLLGMGAAVVKAGLESDGEGRLPDVSHDRLLDLIERDDRTLATALGDLVAELPEQTETILGWPNFMEPSEPTSFRPQT